MYLCVMPVDHDRRLYQPGEPIDVQGEQATALLDARAIRVVEAYPDPAAEEPKGKKRNVKWIPPVDEVPPA